MGKPDPASAVLSMCDSAVLQYIGNHAEKTGDNCGGDSDPLTGESCVRAGLYQVVAVPAGLCGVGEAFPGDLLSDIMTGVINMSVGRKFFEWLLWLLA